MRFPGRLTTSGVGSTRADPGADEPSIRNGEKVAGPMSPEKARFNEESDLSPRSRPSTKYEDRQDSFRVDIAPWEQEPAGDFDHGSELTAARTVEDFPEPQWGSMSVQSNEGDLSPSSSTFPSFMRRPSAFEDPAYSDDRRPSLATSGSSNASSRNNSKSLHKLHSFFGDDPNDSRRGSHLQVAQDGASEKPASVSKRPTNGRKMSWNSSVSGFQKSRQVSPEHSRPRTPQQLLSEVTPWDFQNPQDVDATVEATVQEGALNSDKERKNDRRQATFPLRSGHAPGGHRLHLHRHRHQTSSDSQNGNGSSIGGTSRQNSYAVARRDTQPAMTNARNPSQFSIPKEITPRPSMSAQNNDFRGYESGGAKRTLMDKLRGRKRDDKSDPDLLRHPDEGSTTSLPMNGRSRQVSQSSNAPVSKDLVNSGAARSSSATRPNVPHSASKKDLHSRLPFKSKRGASTEGPLPKISGPINDEPIQNQSLWSLDTDLSQMEGIVSNPMPFPVPSVSDPNSLSLIKSTSRMGQSSFGTHQGVWDAPDSWAVKKVLDENGGKLEEIDEGDVLQNDGDEALLYAIRIFRHDATFVTLSLKLNATAAEIIQLFAKKSLVQKDDLDNYHIIMRKHNTSKQLEASEKPVALQKAMLELAGYTDTDRIAEAGFEDHSYLCRFTFSHAKMTGYASLDRDPAFSKSQKMNNVDLAGMSLITIPIGLYQKCPEIVAINLSRNIAIDVPKDFIDACTGLREIKFTSNEALRLPPSFCLASKLIILDVSNNRLEELEHAQLDRLESLSALNLANNKLRSLPDSFSTFRSLRRLVLSSNHLNELPQGVCEIETLVDLDVSFNQISILSNIGRLSALERLYATNNKLSGPLDASMSNLTKLRELDIRFNNVDNIDVCASIPQLELLSAGHNLITIFQGSLPNVRILHLDHNPVTTFGLETPALSLATLDLASAKLASLPEDLFQKLPNLQALNLNKNYFNYLSPKISLLQKLEKLSVAKNSLDNLPAEIGRLALLKVLNIRENNLSRLPTELWFCRSLDTLNASCNVLDSFPKPPTTIPAHADLSTLATEPISEHDPEEKDKVSEMGQRRPSQASGYMGSATSSPGTTTRKGSMVSFGAVSRKPSTMSRSSTETTLAPLTRKDSSVLNRTTGMFAGSLKYLYLADNRLSDEVFDQVGILHELKVLNLSYNELDDIPSRSMRRLQNLEELYLSHNALSSLPSEDLEELSNLRVLFINSNRFQVLPAELGKLTKLTVLDAGTNSLKYNVYNWPYDWNWNVNPDLKYLSLSGNKRLEIKPPIGHAAHRDNHSLTDFSGLQNLRILGLMDVTLMIPSVPDNTEDRRVRTSGSNIGMMGYGIADCLGHLDHLSTLDIIVPKLEGHDEETLFGLIDGVPQANGGSKAAKYLQSNFEMRLKDELKRAKASSETACDALRRTYLSLNRDLAAMALQPAELKGRRQEAKPVTLGQSLSPDDLNFGCVATVMYLHGMDLYVSNVGDAQAVMIQSEGGHRFITTKHDPASTKERQRIREAGGYVSRQGKLNDQLNISRAFGFTHLMPSIIAAPSVSQIHIDDSDEMILIASRELWDYLTPDFVVDLARSERADLMRAAQKLRDLAIAFGARGKITVMLVGVSDLRRKEKARYRSHSLSLGPSGLPDEYMSMRRGKRGRDQIGDSKLARLDDEVRAPEGEVTLVFTDIKNSTVLWETHPTAMRSAIKLHNEVMRRHLRLIGGYEVKTEGDAFMVAFSTVTSALLWAFTIQIQLLDVPWPQEILSSASGQEVRDSEGNLIFRGLSVRMGIHWGEPLCETDVVTKRMDYFGQMVNRAARIEGVADGGQITVSADYIQEVQRLLETHIETDRSNAGDSEEQYNDDILNANIRRELRSLSSHGFEVKDLGEKRLKGLENPEYIYLMYPHALASRIQVQQQLADAEKAAAEASAKADLSMDLDDLWSLWSVSLRLEMLCSALETSEITRIKPPETSLLERTKANGGEITDRFLMGFIEHQVLRVETCVTTLGLRNLVRPFKDGMFPQACGMSDIFAELSTQLEELRRYKENNDIDIAPS